MATSSNQHRVRWVSSVDQLQGPTPPQRPRQHPFPLIFYTIEPSHPAPCTIPRQHHLTACPPLRPHDPDPLAPVQARAPPVSAKMHLLPLPIPSMRRPSSAGYHQRCWDTFQQQNDRTRISSQPKARVVQTSGMRSFSMPDQSTDSALALV